MKKNTKLTWVLLHTLLLGQLRAADYHTSSTNSRGNVDQKPLVMDLGGIAIPEYPNMPPGQVLSSSINYFINQVGKPMRPELCLLSDNTKKEIVESYVRSESYSIENINLDSAHDTKFLQGHQAHVGSCIDQWAIDTLTQDYPYSCKGKKGANGDPAYRLDWLVYRLMTQDVYHRTNKIPATQEEFDRKVGTPFQFNNVKIERKIIENSGVTGERRIIAFTADELAKAHGGITVQTREGQKQNVSSIFSYDRNKDIKSKKPDFFQNPIDSQVDAVEGFYTRANGLWDYTVWDVTNQKRLDAAPGGVADFQMGLSIPSDFPSVKAHVKFNSVRNAVDCMICHVGGTLSNGTTSVNKEAIALMEKRRLGGLFSESQVMKARELFNVPIGKENDENHKASANVDSVINRSGEVFASAVEKIGIKDSTGELVPILPDITATYNAPVSYFQLIRELGTTDARLQKALESKPHLMAALGMDSPKNFGARFDRSTVEEVFCELHAAVNGNPYVAKPKVDKKETENADRTTKADDLLHFEVSEPYPVLYGDTGKKVWEANIWRVQNGGRTYFDKQVFVNEREAYQKMDPKNLEADWNRMNPDHKAEFHRKGSAPSKPGNRLLNLNSNGPSYYQ